MLPRRHGNDLAEIGVSGEGIAVLYDGEDAMPQQLSRGVMDKRLVLVYLNSSAGTYSSICIWSAAAGAFCSDVSVKTPSAEGRAESLEKMM